MMAFSNSPLINFTLISPNSSARTGGIDKITIHHVAGNLSVEQIGNVFQSPARQASSNYGIDGNGRVGLYVPESRRSWASSSFENDNRAITIEVSNSTGAPDWRINDVAYSKLIELCVDICRRNNIRQLVYNGQPSGSLTRHNMFVATACPGPFLQARFPEIARTVTARLNGTQPNGGDIMRQNFNHVHTRVRLNQARSIFLLPNNNRVGNLPAGTELIVHYTATILTNDGVQFAWNQVTFQNNGVWETRWANLQLANGTGKTYSVLEENFRWPVQGPAQNCPDFKDLFEEKTIYIKK